MRNAECDRFGVKVGGIKISNLRYADDTALIESTEEGITEFTNSVNEAGKALYLKLNMKRSKLKDLSISDP